MATERSRGDGNQKEGNDEGGTDGGSRLAVKQLDDYVAAGIIAFYGVVVILVMNGTLSWANLPDSLQYWVTNALVLALGVLFGKGAYRFRQRRKNL